MRTKAGQVWYFELTDEILLLLAIRSSDMWITTFDTFNLLTGRVCRDSPRSIENDERWELLADR